MNLVLIILKVLNTENMVQFMIADVNNCYYYNQTYVL